MTRVKIQPYLQGDINMSQALEKRLLEILEEELHIYQEIQAIKLMENQALLNFSVRGLEHSNSSMENWVQKATILEEERRDVAWQIAQGAQLECDGEPSLRQIAPVLARENRGRAELLAKKISSVCVDIGKLQFSNTNLIERSLNYVRELIEHLLHRLQLQAVAYNPSGALVSGKEVSPGLLDRRI